MNTALDFGLSNNQFVNIPAGSSLNLADHATWEMWFKGGTNVFQSGLPNTLLSRWGAVTGTQSWKFYISAAGTSQFIQAVFSPNGNGGNIYKDYVTIPLNQDQWYHIAWVFDGTQGSNDAKIKLYLNGQLQNPLNFNENIDGNPPGTALTSLASTTENMKIGVSGEANDYFEGAIDDVRIWNVSRSESEIQSDYQSELLGNEAGLVGYWKLNEGAGMTAADSTPNGNTGTLTGSPLWEQRQSLASQDLIFNEINWAGSTNPDNDQDEWIELKNTTTSPISLSGMTLEGTATGSDVIALSSGSIAPNGLYLISRLSTATSKLSDGVPDLIGPDLQIDNSDQRFVLKDSFGHIIDEVDDGSGTAFAGSGGIVKASMERISPVGSGTLATSWKTATTVGANFDGGTADLGTPKAEND